jgi:hypothetical protein
MAKEISSRASDHGAILVNSETQLTMHTRCGKICKVLTFLRIASISKLIKTLSFLVFFWRSLKLAVFLRDCSLRRC